MKEADMVWQPGIGLGPIKFGMTIERARAFVELEQATKMLRDEEDVSYDNEALGLSVWDDDPDEEGIDTMRVARTLMLRDRNVIGMKLAAFSEMIGLRTPPVSDTVKMPEGDLKQVYDFDALGAEIWVRNGVIVTVMLGPIYEYD
ncbi:hypothetical protein [Minwuia sp.]|uniref:hypothetical protein n=1 Tax=Minwuia sp. TaxID=2493630 RepID=UPI003A935391